MGQGDYIHTSGKDAPMVRPFRHPVNEVDRLEPATMAEKPKLVNRHARAPRRGGRMRSSLVVECCPRDMECNEKPRDHDAACGNQGMMDARPPAAGAIAPEPCGDP